MTWIAIDIETKSPTDDGDLALDYRRAIPTSLAWWGEHGKRGVASTPEAMTRFLDAHPDARWVGHNLKFDVKVLGFYLGRRLEIAWDTQLAEAIQPDRPDSLKLETVVAKELGLPPWKSKQLYAQMRTGTAAQAAIEELNLIDAEYTYRVFKKQWQTLEELGLLDFYLNSPLALRGLRFLREIEERGMALNRPLLDKTWKAYLERRKQVIAHLTTEFADLVRPWVEAKLGTCTLKPPKAGATEKVVAKYHERLRAFEAKHAFDWGSPKQVLWLLRDQLGFPCLNLEGKPATSKDVLIFLKGQHPVIEPLLELRSLEHDIASFFESWNYYDREGRIYPSYRLDGTKTFRLSCSNPNLQQVPRPKPGHPGFRNLFIAAPGKKLMVVDYSQVEPRMIALYTKDPVLTQIYQYGMDIYEVVARKVMGWDGPTEEFKTTYKDKREVAKKTALSSFYGIGPDKFAWDLAQQGVFVPINEARGYINGYFELLAGVLEYKRTLPATLEMSPMFQTVLGRTLFFKPFEFYHLAFNKIIQCSGSDLNLYSQVELDELLKAAGMEARCIHLVHDEAIFEYPPEEEPRLRQAVQWMMADRYAQPPFSFTVPITVEIKTGDSWACK